MAGITSATWTLRAPAVMRDGKEMRKTSIVLYQNVIPLATLNETIYIPFPP